VRLFQEYSKRLTKPPKGVKGFDRVDQPTEKFPCHCPLGDKSKKKKKKNGKHDELRMHQQTKNIHLKNQGCAV
jgi:hypothetical protein